MARRERTRWPRPGGRLIKSLNLSLSAALAIGLGAFGASAQTPGPPIDQSGPRSAPLTPPPFPRTPPPRLAPAAPAPQGQAESAERRFLLSSVDVETHDLGGVGAGAARVRRGWKPRQTVGVSLRGAPGEAMDEHWVRRQFELNGLVCAPGRQDCAPTTSDRVVALVLRINEAFVQNGYINTGILLSRSDWPTPEGVLKLTLMKGAITPSRPGCPRVVVVWSTGVNACQAGSGAAKPPPRSLQDFGHAAGSGGLTTRYVLDRMPAAGRRPLNTADLEREFRRLSDDDALSTINTTLTPGRTPGEAQLTLRVTPPPRVDVYGMVASSRSPSVGGIRYSGGAVIRNLLLSGDVLNVDGGETRGLADGTVTYSSPFFWPSARLGLSAAIDQAAVLDRSVLALGIRSSDRSFEASLTQRLIDEPLQPPTDGKGLRAAQTLDVGLHIVNRHSESSLDGMPFSFGPGSTNGVTNLNVLRAEGYYVRKSDSSVLVISAVGSLGLTGSGSDVPGVVTPDTNFKALLLQTSYLLRLRDLFAGGASFKAVLDAQGSVGPLYASEQFSAGGDTVRGYRQNLLLADEGVRGTLELICPIGLGRRLCDLAPLDFKSLQLSVFADAAYLHDHQGAQPIPSGIASLGVAAVWSPKPGLAATVSYGSFRLPNHLTGVQDLQDHGLLFTVAVHPLAFVAR